MMRLCLGAAWAMALSVGVAMAQESAKPAPVVVPPVVPAAGPGRRVVGCDPGGCWDEFGGRYDRADMDVFIRGDGRSCLLVRGRMHCE
jgi:hypothetical protein